MTVPCLPSEFKYFSSVIKLFKLIRVKWCSCVNLLQFNVIAMLVSSCDRITNLFLSAWKFDSYCMLQQFPCGGFFSFH